jgi:hypothetical protein
MRVHRLLTKLGSFRKNDLNNYVSISTGYTDGYGSWPRKNAVAKMPLEFRFPRLRSVRTSSCGFLDFIYCILLKLRCALQSRQTSCKIH